MVEDVNPVGGHDHLDVLGCLEPVQLIEELQHGPLYLAVSAAARLYPGTADAVDLVHEDNGRGVLSGHHEQLPHHPAALANELLDQLGSRHSEVIGYTTSLTCDTVQLNPITNYLTLVF